MGEGRQGRAQDQGIGADQVISELKSFFKRKSFYRQIL